MNLFQVDDAGCLFISPTIEDWSLLASKQIDTIFDLDGALDSGVPTVPDQCLYVFFPIYDEALPNLSKLSGLATLGASLIQDGHHVLSHCGMGFNRSALLAGIILHRLGMTGPAAIERLRQRRPGALFNETFAAYLLSL